MLDIKLIRERPDYVRDALAKRFASVDFSELLGWDETRRTALVSLEQKRSQRNDVSAKVPALKKAGADVQPVFAEMKALGTEIKTLEDQVGALDQKVNDFLARLPNLPDDDVLAGGKDNNQVIETWGTKPVFAFQPKDHVALLGDLGMVDYARGTKLGGSGFWVY